MNKNLILVGTFNPYENSKILYLEKKNINVISLDLLPRIRAQSMDVLSSKFSVNMAVVLASNLFKKALPMMTAAGTIIPAKCLFWCRSSWITTIATAKRLGCVVTADVRPEVEEQVKV